MSRREDLLRQLAELNFYWKELAEGKSETELEQILTELKLCRQTIKNIFPFQMMGG
jgi:hypothetical protein